MVRYSGLFVVMQTNKGLVLCIQITQRSRFDQAIVLPDHANVYFITFAIHIAEYFVLVFPYGINNDFRYVTTSVLSVSHSRNLYLENLFS